MNNFLSKLFLLISLFICHSIFSQNPPEDFTKEEKASMATFNHDFKIFLDSAKKKAPQEATPFLPNLYAEYLFLYTFLGSEDQPPLSLDQFSHYLQHRNITLARVRPFDFKFDRKIHFNMSCFFIHSHQNPQVLKYTTNVIVTHLSFHHPKTALLYQAIPFNIHRSPKESLTLSTKRFRRVKRFFDLETFLNLVNDGKNIFSHLPKGNPIIQFVHELNQIYPTKKFRLPNECCEIIINSYL